MINKMRIKKGSSRLIKSSNISSKQAQKISKAIMELQNTQLQLLQKTGKIKKLKLPNLSNVYSFRAGMSERIIFSQVDDKLVIHDIVDVRNNKSIISLISSEEN